MDEEGCASGSLYLDEGDKLEQPETSEIEFSYKDGELSVGGKFGYQTEVVIRSVVVLGGAGNSSGGYETGSKKLEGPISLVEASTWKI